MVLTQIELKHSVWLWIAIGVMVLLAVMSIAMASLEIIWRVLLVVLVLAASGWGAWKARRPLPSLRLKSNGQIQLSVAGADWSKAEVLPGCFVSPSLTAVRLRTAEAKIYRLTLLPDSAPAQHLRRLRVSLRWASHIHSDTAFQDAG
jgi:toxin CptA